MTHAQIATMIQSIGLPFAYYQFPNDTPQSPPFICFLYPDNNDVIADNTNYQKIERLVIELYTDDKDFLLEQAVEAVLNANGLVFSRDEEFLDSERMHETIYETNVIITEDLTNGEQNQIRH